MIWAFLEKLSIQIIQFLVGVLLARILTPEDFGVVSIIMALLIIIQNIIEGGFSQALIQKKERTNIDLSTVFYLNIFLGFVLYIALYFLAPAISIFYNLPSLTDFIRVLGLNIILYSFIIVDVTVCTFKNNFKIQAKFSLVASLVSGSFALFFAYLGFGTWALIFQSLIFYFALTIQYWFFSGWRPQKTFSKNSIYELFNFGSKLLVTNLIHTLYTQLNAILIGRFFSVKSLGYYSTAEKFGSLPLGNLILAFQKVSFPKLAEAQNDSTELKDITRNYVKKMSIIVFFVFLQLAAIAKPLILFVIGDKWSNSIIFLQLISLGFLFDHIFAINLNLIKAVGKSNLILKLELIKKGISVVILLVMMYYYGIIGLCLAKAIYAQIGFYINAYYSGKFFNYGYYQQWGDIYKYLLIAIFSVLPSYLFSEYSEDRHIYIIIYSSLISGFIYILILQVIKDKSFFALKFHLLNQLNSVFKKNKL
ncbi:MAG: lipopolysaccharide biosynthesis protein [Jejuia sp.]